jgi:hypothetical protein
MRFRAIALTVGAFTICGLPFSGCGPSNEATLKGESKVVPQNPDMPTINSYGDLLKYKMEEAKTKGKGATKKAR